MTDLAYNAVAAPINRSGEMLGAPEAPSLIAGSGSRGVRRFSKIISTAGPNVYGGGR